MIKTFEYPTTYNEKVADWFEKTHPEQAHDIDPDMTFIDLYINAVEGDSDIFIDCGEDMDIFDDVIWELCDRMDIDYSEFRENLLN